MRENNKNLVCNVGDTVYLRILEHSNAARQYHCTMSKSSTADVIPESWVKAAQVTKIGRKYITVRFGACDLQFDKENGAHNAGSYSPEYTLFCSMEEALDDVRTSVLKYAVKNHFDKMFLAGRDAAMGLSQLEEIASIIGVEIPWQRKPRCAAVILLQCMHDHEYGTDGKAFILSSREDPGKVAIWAKEKKFDFEAEKGEQFNWDTCRVVINLADTVPASPEEGSSYIADIADREKFCRTYPSNLRQILVGSIEDVVRDMFLKDIDCEKLADEIMTEPAYQQFKESAVGIDVLVDGTDAFNNAVWATYDMAEAKLCPRK